MKKIVSLFLFCFICFCSIAQIANCNEKLLMSIKGTWSKYPQQPMEKPVTKPEFDMVTKKMEAFHKLLLEAYPQGIGCEPQVNMINPRQALVAPWVYDYNYYTAIFPYFCNRFDKPEKASGTNTTFTVHVNSLGNFWTSTFIFINGQNVFERTTKAGKWKGYEVYYSEEAPVVILTRKDMLPYKPVTRKQYLDYMIHYFDSLYTDMANQYKKVDDPSMKEQAATITTSKNEILKVYRKELEKSAAKNLLDSAAVVKGIGNVRFSEDTDIFTTEEKGGIVLLMVNQAYFRKDLPKYVPQCILVKLKGTAFDESAIGYFTKMIKENFPFEKLQAMIDK